MQLGPEIKIDGKRPEWLKDDEKIGIVWRNGEVWDTINSRVDCAHGWESSIAAIMLPADHPYYLATSNGFTYWPGGECEPDDWDGGDCLMRIGRILPCGYDDQPEWSNQSRRSDIIGYRRKTKSDAVSINPITRAEAYEDGLDIPTLEKLGLLKEETLLERFARENPYYSLNELKIIGEFIEWQENNQ